MAVWYILQNAMPDTCLESSSNIFHSQNKLVSSCWAKISNPHLYLYWYWIRLEWHRQTVSDYIQKCSSVNSIMFFNEFNNVFQWIHKCSSVVISKQERVILWSYISALPAISHLALAPFVLVLIRLWGLDYLGVFTILFFCFFSISSIKLRFRKLKNVRANWWWGPYVQ